MNLPSASQRLMTTTSTQRMRMPAVPCSIHKLLLSFQVCIRSMMKEGKIDMEEYDSS